MNQKAVTSAILFTAALLILIPRSHALVLRQGDSIFLIDRRGDQWDITQAVSIGFRPEGFRYGIGKNAFTPLEDNDLSTDTDSIAPGARVIGIDNGEDAHAYSVSRLYSHEIANTTLGNDPIAAGY